jgi:hypothetical protein
MSCNRSSQHNSAPKERHNLAQAAGRGPSLSPLPPLPPARESGAEGGVRAIETQGSEGVKKSRLCRLMCGKAPPFRPPGSTLKYLGWAACRKATGFPHIKRRSRNSQRQRFFHTFSRPGLRYFAASRLSYTDSGGRQFMNELLVQETRERGPLGSRTWTSGEPHGRGSGTPFPEVHSFR